MADTDTDLISALLEGTVEQLDLPDELVTRMHLIHADIGGYFAEHLPGDVDWNIYSQGSGRIGTGVPPEGTDEWDLDTVAEADVDKDEITKPDLKDLVAATLQAYVADRADDEKLAPADVESGRRCLTLLYAEPFHVDMLPAVRNPDGPKGGIWITDRDLVRWQPSNPRGYAEWFELQMEREFLMRRTALAKAASVSIDDIPSWRVKTTLQRTVQVLKLHRNSFFAAEPGARPPSCVVTTLAALAYRGEGSLADAVVAAADAMPGYIDTGGAVWVVENPAQPGDNLADRWSAQPGALGRFGPWLADLRSTLAAARSTNRGLPGVAAALSARFDEALVTKSVQRFAERQTERRDAGALVVAGGGALATAVRGAPVRRHTFHGV